ncbi:MAG: hypothetical protein U0X75_08105 [Acidobacteriota bacterium]
MIIGFTEVERAVRAYCYINRLANLCGLCRAAIATEPNRAGADVIRDDAGRINPANARIEPIGKIQ